MEAISDINVVPLADVSLVLLIILLLLSPMMAQSMLHVKTAAQEAQAPAAPETSPPPAAPEMVLVVDLGPRGVAIGPQLFASEADLTAYLKDELPRRTDRKVFLAPHPDVVHGEVVRMLELIKDCGADSVALVQTQEPPDNGQVRPPAP